MRTIYIDSAFKCHVTDDGTMTAVETDVFDGKCDAYIKGYRFIPFGSSWEREDGETFAGESISPWVDYTELDNAQRGYEQQLLEEYKNEKNELNASYQDGINSI